MSRTLQRFGDAAYNRLPSRRRVGEAAWDAALWTGGKVWNGLGSAIYHAPGLIGKGLSLSAKFARAALFDLPVWMAGKLIQSPKIIMHIGVAWLMIGVTGGLGLGLLETLTNPEIMGVGASATAGDVFGNLFFEGLHNFYAYSAFTGDVLTLGEQHWPWVLEQGQGALEWGQGVWNDPWSLINGADTGASGSGTTTAVGNSGSAFDPAKIVPPTKPAATLSTGRLY